MSGGMLVRTSRRFDVQRYRQVIDLFLPDQLTIALYVEMSWSAYCNRTNFSTRFNFVYFVLLAESTKFSSVRKPYTNTSVSDTTVAVRKFLAYGSRQTLEYEFFLRTKISAITVPTFPPTFTIILIASIVSCQSCVAYSNRIYCVVSIVCCVYHVCQK